MVTIPVCNHLVFLGIKQMFGQLFTSIEHFGFCLVLETTVFLLNFNFDPSGNNSLAMAFRLWIGGLPNAVTHEDVQWWLWRETTSWPLTTQIVRKIDATKCVAFVGFSDEGTAQRVLTGIQGRSHFGVRLTTEWSDDSKGGHGKGVSGGASSAGPLPSVEPTEPTSGPVAAHVKDEQVPVKAETKDVDILVKPQLQDVGVMVQPEVQNVAVHVKPETKDVDILVKPQLQDVGVQYSPPPLPSPKTDVLSPTEMAISPTQSVEDTDGSPTEMSEEAPTAIVDEKHAEAIEMEVEKVKVKEELFDTKQELEALQENLLEATETKEENSKESPGETSD